MEMVVRSTFRWMLSVVSLLLYMVLHIPRNIHSQLSARVSNFITDKCSSIAQDSPNKSPNMRLLMEQVNIHSEDKTHRLAWKGAGDDTRDLQRFIPIQR